MKQRNPLTRFSTRARGYQNRSAYPDGLLDYLVTDCDLKPEKVIADIGSGTGYLTRVFLRNGNHVIAVEPNKNMRAVAEVSFGSSPQFTSLEGTAEAIPLANNSVDIVAVGQALHWFEIDMARMEFLRVLRNGGWIYVADIWSCDDADELMRACANFRKAHFEDLGIPADPPLRIVRLFEGFNVSKKVIPTPFACDEQGFCDGSLSSSLAPEAGTVEYEQARRGLQEIFKKFQNDGTLKLSFETIVWTARIDF